jgi:hypothetical protein
MFVESQLLQNSLQARIDGIGHQEIVKGLQAQHSAFSNQHSASNWTKIKTAEYAKDAGVIGSGITSF